MELFLYRISQEVNDDYDTYDSAVVVSCGHSAASMIHPIGSDVYWSGTNWLWAYDNDAFGLNNWAEPVNVTVQRIGSAEPGLKEGDVICTSFNAG